MTSHAFPPRRTNPACHLLPLLAALVLLVPPAVGFSPAPLLHSIRRPPSTHPFPLRSLHDASPAFLGVSGTPSHRSPGQTSLKASDGERSDSGEERHTAPGGGGIPRRAVLLGLPAAALAWLSGLGAATAASVDDAALSYNRWSAPPSSASLGSTDYSRVDLLGLRPRSITFGARKRLGSPDWCAQID